MGFAEGVTAGAERDCLFVVHRHAGERFANITGGSQRIRVTVRAFWVYIDQPHLYRT